MSGNSGQFQMTAVMKILAIVLGEMLFNVFMNYCGHEQIGTEELF